MPHIMTDPGSGGPLGVVDPGNKRTMVVADHGNGGPWEWRTLGVAGRHRLVYVILDLQTFNTVLDERLIPR